MHQWSKVFFLLWIGCTSILLVDGRQQNRDRGKDAPTVAEVIEVATTAAVESTTATMYDSVVSWFGVGHDSDGFRVTNGDFPHRVGKPHMMLVFQWPESLCASEKRGCQLSTVPHLTLHGLWPIERHKVNCRSDFDPESLRLLQRNLSRVWPSYFHQSGMNFWKHEYEKHGSCLYGTMEEYFHTALQLHHDYEPALLASLHPSSSASHSTQDWIDMIKNHFGVDPMLMCRTSAVQRNTLEDVQPFSSRTRSHRNQWEDEMDDSNEHHTRRSQKETKKKRRRQRNKFKNPHLLVEVGLCFTSDLALVDCPSKGRIRRCPRHGRVELPPTHSLTKPRS